jgi:hypothetical protein
VHAAVHRSNPLPAHPRLQMRIADAHCLETIRTAINDCDSPNARLCADDPRREARRGQAVDALMCGGCLDGILAQFDQRQRSVALTWSAAIRRISRPGSGPAQRSLAFP